MTRKRRGKKPQSPQERQWYKFDLHIHTPASSDFQQANVSYLDVLREAERKGLDALAFTDHNTVSGYRRMMEEIDDLELLERLGRLTPEEDRRLKEYRRLHEELLILPGLEFTATLGFHIIGIFNPDTTVRELEFLLRELNVPPEKLDDGSTELGATTDVLTAYRLIDEAGGIVIAAHANSSHGVALQGLSFGGQTRIAYTQDSHLHALEVTDMEKKGKTTARFFDGSKPEYPRRMHCIQGSDSHRLTRDTTNTKNLGVGDRVAEILLPDLTFEALREVFLGQDFARTRPYRPEAPHPFDYIQAAREEGPNIVQDFHAQYSKRGGFLDAIVADVCAFANTNGGTLYIGIPDDPRKPPTGIGASPARVVAQLQSELQGRITPALNISSDIQETQGVKVMRVVVPRGIDPPYAVDESQIYLRSEAETTLAVRDEIVELVRQGLRLDSPQPSSGTVPEPPPPPPVNANGSLTVPQIAPPRTGVEITAVEVRNGTRYYTMRDLRNGSLVTNVTRRSARRLWHYAIEECEGNPVNAGQVRWMGDLGLWKRREHGNLVRFDLVQRISESTMRIYYGVTEEGLHGPWNALVGE